MLRIETHPSFSWPLSMYYCSEDICHILFKYLHPSYNLKSRILNIWVKYTTGHKYKDTYSV